MAARGKQSAIKRNRVTGAEGIHWDLKDLFSDRRALEACLEEADRQAEAFASRYRGKLGSMGAQELVKALGQFEDLHEKVGRAHSYAYLYWVTDTEEPERGALLQKVRELSSRITQKVVFFELEWIHLQEEKARCILDADAVRPYRHYLELQRLYRDHVLSEGEEKILSEKAVTGRSAWNRFFEEALAGIRFELDGEELAEQEVLSRLYDPEREVRRKAALSLTRGLQSRLRDLTYVFNVILADHASDDRLRNYSHWLEARNLSNEISSRQVEALTQAVTGRYDLVARYYRLKRRLLGLDELYDYDRYAPVVQSEVIYPWSRAKELVLQAYHDFHPRLGEIVGEFFEGNWIDAAVRPGKRGGAFCHRTVPTVHPYILLNYSGTLRDVQTLAHELGHGVHSYLARKQTLLQLDPPLTTAETASVFGEMLVFNRLMEEQDNREARLSLLMGRIDDSIATVFRQVAMNRFEDLIHNSRRREGELSADRFSQFWLQTQEEMFQGSVRLGEHYRIWWSYIPHFVHTPGYVYAYAFGELLTLALFTRYREEGSAFTPKYLELLEAGGSDWPHVLVGKLGVDLNDTDFWQQGLAVIEELIRQAEELTEG